MTKTIKVGNLQIKGQSTVTNGAESVVLDLSCGTNSARATFPSVTGVGSAFSPSSNVQILCGQDIDLVWTLTATDLITNYSVSLPGPQIVSGRNLHCLAYNTMLLRAYPQYTSSPRSFNNARVLLERPNATQPYPNTGILLDCPEGQEYYWVALFVEDASVLTRRRAAIISLNVIGDSGSGLFFSVFSGGVASLTLSSNGYVSSCVMRSDDSTSACTPRPVANAVLMRHMNAVCYREPDAYFNATIAASGNIWQAYGNCQTVIDWNFEQGTITNLTFVNMYDSSIISPSRVSMTMTYKTAWGYTSMDLSCAPEQHFIFPTTQCNLSMQSGGHYSLVAEEDIFTNVGLVVEEQDAI